MANMNNEAILDLLKKQLELITEYMDAEAAASKNAELLQYIVFAERAIETEGITLVDDIEDRWLVSTYALWLYDKRKTTGSKYTSYYIQNMPRMLRYNLNNRLFKEKVTNDS